MTTATSDVSDSEDIAAPVPILAADDVASHFHVLVGDGVNDAPALKSTDISMAMSMAAGTTNRRNVFHGNE